MTIKKFIVNTWKHSVIRFYIKNTIWNYKFWLFAKKMYKNVTYQIEDGDYNVDVYYHANKNKKVVSKKRFVGYLYNKKLYIDNPGFHVDDYETWKSWKRKKLID